MLIFNDSFMFSFRKIEIDITWSNSFITSYRLSLFSCCSSYHHVLHHHYFHLYSHIFVPIMLFSMLYCMTHFACTWTVVLHDSGLRSCAWMEDHGSPPCHLVMLSDSWEGHFQASMADLNSSPLISYSDKRALRLLSDNASYPLSSFRPHPRHCSLTAA